jgi:hypothetical protein
MEWPDLAASANTASLPLKRDPLTTVHIVRLTLMVFLQEHLLSNTTLLPLSIKTLGTTDEMTHMLTARATMTDVSAIVGATCQEEVALKTLM